MMNEGRDKVEWETKGRILYHPAIFLFSIQFTRYLLLSIYLCTLYSTLQDEFYYCENVWFQVFIFPNLIISKNNC